MATKTSDVRDAAARVSSTPPSFSQKGGLAVHEEAWDLTRGKIARAVSADPDILLYMLYLSSNKASAQVAKVAKILGELLPLVEGWKYKQTAPGTSSSLARAYSRASARSYVDSDELATLSAEVSKYVGEELAPSVSVRGRSQVKGSEALAKYRTKKKELLQEWKRLKLFLGQVGDGPRMSGPDVRQLAVAVAMENLGKTLEIEDDDNAEEKMLQVLASSAAVQVLGREVDFRYRLLIAESSAFPAGATVSVTYTDGMVSGLTPSPDPTLLGVKSGDQVSWGAGTAIVSAVSSTSIALRSSTISSETGVLKVYPAAYESLQDTTSSISTREAALPTVGALGDELIKREEGSAAHIKLLVQYLSNLLADLDSVPSSVQSIAGRLGVDITEPGQTIREVLDAYGPSFGRKTAQAGDQLLDSLEASGDDYAADLLMRGNVLSTLRLRATETSRMGRVTEAAGTLSTYAMDS